MPQVPRMRTVKKAMEEIRAIDSDTDFTERALRRMIANNEIAVVTIGNKKLINLDLLLEKLSGCEYNDSAIRVS